jgi:hypothetical protein
LAPSAARELGYRGPWRAPAAVPTSQPERVEIKELWGWVGAPATLSTNLRGDVVGVYDNRKWRHVKPHLDDMLERRTVRISPLPMAPRHKKTKA